MDYNKAIESLSFKFCLSVSQYDIFRWLRNFDESEWDMALNILDKVVYYSSDRIDETLECQIRNIINAHHDKNIYILPTGKIGKSGYVMAYHAKKVIEKITPKQRFLKLITVPELSLVKKNDVIVLLDDFSGTGKSIKEFYENNIKSYIEGKNIKICALTVAFLEHARLLLETELNINVYGDVYYPAFMRRGSVFGYEKNMIPVREFCFKKGEILFPNWKSTNMKPLGFMNSQALVCFEHTTPNNTLPIIWYDTIIPGTNKEWHSLFPRFTNYRIERGRRMRLASNFWLSAISRLNFNNIEWSRNHTVESLRLISYIAQKYHGKSDLYIAQILGISISDIEEIIKLGKERQLIDNEGYITTKAKNIYEEIRKKDKILEHSISKKIINKNIDKVYVPKSFRGIT